MRIVFDIEGNGLPETVSRVWCIVCHDIDTGETHEFGPDQMPEFRAFIPSVTEAIGHHILGYDLPVLHKILGIPYTLDSWDGVPVRFVDTYYLSMADNPDRIGGHSVKAWTNHLEGDDEKVHIAVWDKYSPEILERCRTDVVIQVGIYRDLAKRIARRYGVDEEVTA